MQHGIVNGKEESAVGCTTKVLLGADKPMKNDPDPTQN
jgi:hypothetical protein